MSKKNELSRRQESFLTALLEHPSVSAACKVSGCSVSTGFRYLNDENFNKIYRSRRRKAFGQVSAVLTKVANMAVVTLAEIINDKSAPMTARVNSCRTILQYAQSGLTEESTAAEMAEILQEIEREKEIDVRR